MRKNRIATTENCCKRSIDALLSICRRLNAGKKANEINLSFKLRRLNRIIRERRDYTTMRVVSETMCEMFSLILENDNLAKLFYENNFILDFATRFQSLDVPREYKENFSDKLREYMAKSGSDDANVNMMLGIAANAGVLCDTLELSRLRIEFYKNLNVLNSASIYFAVINNLVDVDRKIIYRLKKLCNITKDSPISEAASIKNPVYVLLNFLQHKCIRSTKDFELILSDNNMFMMVVHPASFNAENFNPQWWKLLTDPHLQERIARSHRNAEIIIEKLKAYRSNCFGNNIIYYDDVIKALADYSELAL